jgi:uncharacterized protein DUF1579
MPEVTDTHRKLHRFAGHWRSDETMFETPWTKGGPAQGAVKAEVILGGFFVKSDYEQARNGAVSFLDHSLVTFDQADAQVKLFGFDSLGFVPPAPAAGQWQDDRLILIRTSPRGQARHDYLFENEDTYRLALSNSTDGGKNWVDVLRGVYRRAG